MRASRVFRGLVCRIALLVTLALVSSSTAVRAGETTGGKGDDQPIDKQMQAKRRPQVYITVFNNGYSGDPMPQEPEKFDKLLKVITGEGNFNAVMCRYTEQREALCRKYNVLMVVDLLATGHHVFRNPKQCETLCNKLRNNPAVVAYHLWSDRFGSMGPGRTRDINNVHRWDPTHATYIGTYKTGGMQFLAKSDFISYYDFHWKRGPHKNFAHLLTAWRTAKIHDNRIGRYVTTDPAFGRTGDGNYQRSLYTQNTSIACGLKGCLWFIGSRIMDMNTLELGALGKDVARVNAWTKPMWAEIPKLGLPVAVYSTSITKDYNNRDVPQGEGETGKMPPGLENNAFPADFWIQPASGEFVMGVFKYDGGSCDAVYLANHNAYAEQNVKLKLGKPAGPRLFNRQSAAYEDLKVIDGAISFKLEKAGGQLVLFGP